MILHLRSGSNLKKRYYSTKRYGHELGLSACFRQWRAKSHCNQLHGYALAFTFTFGCSELDENGWVLDFGALKPVKQWLEETFDHKLLVARDDPHHSILNNYVGGVLADVITVRATGAEAFAELAHDYVSSWLAFGEHGPRVYCKSVEVSEHGANSAIYEVEDE